MATTYRMLGLSLTLGLLLLSGCGGSGDGGGSGSDPASGEDTTQSNTDRDSIAFVTNQQANFWLIAEAGCKEAEKDFDVTVEFRMPSVATAVEQKRVVEDLLNSGVKAVAISPIDAENQVGMLNEVAAKVPLITHDSDAPGTDRLMYIGMDNYRAGRMCGKLVKQALPEGGKVMIFIGRLEQDNSKHRRQGVIDELLDRSEDKGRFDPVDEPIKGEKYTILGTLTDGGSQDDCKRKAEDCLNTYPDVNGMVGLFEYNPVAIYQAIKGADQLGKVKIIGFDENAVTLQAIRDGHCVGTIVQDPFQYGYQSIEVLSKILKEGKESLPEERMVDIPAKMITKENVDKFEDDLKAIIGD